jgi:hypothetical protein
MPVHFVKIKNEARLCNRRPSPAHAAAAAAAAALLLLLLQCNRHVNPQSNSPSSMLSGQEI